METSAEDLLDTTAEQILYLLAASGVQFVFFHPGTDTAPLQEAVLSLQSKALPCPTVLTCAYESVGLAAAHGFWKVRRQPQAVIVHVDIGTQNLGAMLHNAQRDHAGVVILAGKAPYTIAGSAAGGRSNYIHWQQDEPDQAGIVRNYVKWSQEITRPDVTSRAVGRAIQAARAEPAGPVYLMVAREVLMESAGKDDGVPPGRYAVPRTPGMSAESLRIVTDELAAARRPVIITSRAGSRTAAVEPLRLLAETLGAQVFGRPESLNVPWRHPLYLRDTRAVHDALSEADVVLVIDCAVPWIPGDVSPRANAVIIQIDLDPVKLDMPLWSFPVDLSIQADSAIALPQLVDSLARASADEPTLSATWSARRHRLASAPVSAEAKAVGERDADGVHTRDLMQALNSVLDQQDVVVDESVTGRAALHQWLDRSVPGTLLSSGGPGLGWALGACVGVKLADPGRRVVAVVGDGSFLFGQPVAAFMLSGEAQAPFMTVILNNKGYRASRVPVFQLFPDGQSVRTGEAVATRFAVNPDFALIAAGCGAYGERVGTQAELIPALERCLEALSEGRCAVADILVEPY